MTDSSTSDVSNEASNNDHSPTHDQIVLAELRALLFSQEQMQTLAEHPHNDTSPNPEEEVLAELRTLLFTSEQTQVDNIQERQQASKNNPAKNPEEDVLAEVGALLLGDKQQQIAQLQERLNDPKLYAADLSRVLPEAIILRSLQDQLLAKALIPSIEEAIKASVRKDFKILANALFPVIGPAIRKAIASALNTMMQSLNQTLNHSLSPQSFKWRLEARQTGKSFAEVVLLRTLLYRVEQVFLIHKQTGLLLQHVVAKAVTTQDGDLVSAMLTAIKDFVHDSFTVQQTDSLETLQFGELSIWIEEGPQAILAGVIRGNAPQEIRAVFHNAIESIHLEQSNALETFDGDTAVFESCKPYLEDCLLVQFELKESKKPKNQKIIIATVLGAIALTVGPWIFFYIRDQQRWTTYLEKLNTERGIVVIAADKRHGKFFISGLRDPLAADPLMIMKSANLSPAQVISRWESYLSQQPEFVEARAKQVLQPPQTVSLKVDENNILYATGYASEQWIAESRKLLQLIPGINQFRLNLVDPDLRELQLSKDKIEHSNLSFLEGTQLSPGSEQTIQTLVKEIPKLFNSAQIVNQRVQIQIVGHTDSDGSQVNNIKLSQARAQKVLSILNSQGLKTINFTTVGVGSRDSLLGKQSKISNRRVSFKVSLTDALKRKSTNR